MRYFRDLGVDAHLLLWADDCVGPMSHFRPENDSWDPGRWAPFIHRKDIEQSIVAFVGNPRHLRLPVTGRRVRREFGGFDRYVGTGYAAGILARGGLRLDIYYPFGVGIEYVGDVSTRRYLKAAPFWKRWIVSYVRQRQVSGIRNATNCLNCEMSLTRQTFQEIGKGFVPLAIPMVYLEEAPSEGNVPQQLLELGGRLRRYDLSIVSHCSQTWVPRNGISKDEWDLRSKHNDWLIRGFAALCSQRPEKRSLLVLLEYGPDVDDTKRLCRELGIEADVLWLPKMPRKELLYVIGCCTIGVGEFRVGKGMMWGGTGWEVLAMGKPLLQSCPFSSEEFGAWFGHELPPMLEVREPEDVGRHLIECLDSPAICSDLGDRALAWFRVHQGRELAAEWLALLEESGKPKRSESER